MSVALTQGGSVYSRNGVPALYPIYAGMLVVPLDISSSADGYHYHQHFHSLST